MYNIRLILYTEEKQKVKFARERNLLTWSKFSFFQIISVNRRRSSSNFRGLLWRHFRLDYVTKWRHKYYNLAAIMVGPTCPTVQLAPVSLCILISVVSLLKAWIGSHVGRRNETDITLKTALQLVIVSSELKFIHTCVTIKARFALTAEGTLAIIYQLDLLSLLFLKSAFTA